MNVEQLREFCLSLGEDVEEKMPFQKFRSAAGVLVFYVCGHMFCFFDLDKFDSINLKCQPERIVSLKEQYDYIIKPRNLSDKFWIGVQPYNADNNLLRELIKNSYEIVKTKYTKKQRLK